jgi:Cu-Zn family superoxide dismutase
MGADGHQSVSDQDIPAVFRRDLRRWVCATSIVIGSLAALTSPANAWTLGAEASLHDTSEHQVGVARLVQLGDGSVVIQVRVHDMPRGFHGFHVHAVGECVRGTPGSPEAPGVPAIPATPDFASAGGHFDLAMHLHGDPIKHTHGDHSGDLPVLQVNDDGTANAIFTTDRFELADLFDADGSAVIIHAVADNYANIPASRYAATTPGATTPDAPTLLTGDSGARIACGVVKKLIER